MNNELQVAFQAGFKKESGIIDSVKKLKEIEDLIPEARRLLSNAGDATATADEAVEAVRGAAEGAEQASRSVGEAADTVGKGVGYGAGIAGGGIGLGSAGYGLSPYFTENSE